MSFCPGPNWSRTRSLGLGSRKTLFDVLHPVITRSSSPSSAQIDRGQQLHPCEKPVSGDAGIPSASRSIYDLWSECARKSSRDLLARSIKVEIFRALLRRMLQVEMGAKDVAMIWTTQPAMLASNDRTKPVDELQPPAGRPRSPRNFIENHFGRRSALSDTEEG